MNARRRRWVRRTLLSLLPLLVWPAVPAHVMASDDPGDPGPLAVTVEEYDFGDTAFTASELSTAVELRGRVHRPTDLSGGPFPLVLLLHGRHDTCFETTHSFMQWPCAPGRQPIPSYRGYDYVAGVLASHGYIVVSVSANGVNAQDNSVDDGGALARAELLQKHLAIWKDFGTVGGAPFGVTFVGKVDLTKVGTMGHSRGGEGVVRHFLLNQEEGAPYGIAAVFPLAPVNFNRPLINHVPVAVLLPYCDGDVIDLDGVRYYDDSRYSAPGDGAPKHTILVMGANHVFYNTIWTPSIFAAGSVDDWDNWGTNDAEHCGPSLPNERLTEAEQRGTGIAYMSAFFRSYLGGEHQFLPLLTGDVPPPPSAMTDQIFLAYHPPDDPAVRLDVNRLLEASNLSTNTVGGAAVASGLDPYDLCGAGDPQPERCLSDELLTSTEPHAAQFGGQAGLSQLRLGWNDTSAAYENELAAGSRDVSGYGFLQLRASVNFDDARNTPAMDQDFSLTLIDGAGLSSTTRAGDHTRVLFYPPGMPTTPVATSPVPRVVQNGVRVPLSAFPGIFLTDVRAIRLEFDRRPTGALLISDVLFADPAPDKPPAVGCSVGVSSLDSPNHKLENVSLDVEATDDHDPAVTCDVRVFSDEDDAAGLFSPDAEDLGEGTLRLRAERRAHGDGRVYLIVARATDTGGNVGFGCCSVVVPRDQSDAARASVAGQAAAAESLCTTFAAASGGLAPVPAGYFAIGAAAGP